jgi:hypothetical protein
MIRSPFTNLTLSIVLAVSLFSQSAAAHTTNRCIGPIFREHKKLTIITALFAALALVAEPTKGAYELSQELFLKDPVTWMRNAFGWFGKDPKLKSIDPETGIPVYKPGRDAKGALGLVSICWKTLKPLAGLALLIKELDPLCLTGNLVNEAIPAKLS